MRPVNAPGYRPVPDVGECVCGWRYRQWQDDAALICTGCGQQWFVWEEVNEDKSNDGNVS